MFKAKVTIQASYSPLLKQGFSPHSAVNLKNKQQIYLATYKNKKRESGVSGKWLKQPLKK
jgi:hypothetical protein